MCAQRIRRTRKVSGLILIVLLLAPGGGAKAQTAYSGGWTLRVGGTIPATAIHHEDRWRAYHTPAVTLGADWRRGLAGPLAVGVIGDFALGSTVYVESTEPRCASPGATNCERRGSPQLALLRVVAGPGLDVRALRLSTGAGFQADVGGFTKTACILTDQMCDALPAYSWPGLSRGFHLSVGARQDVAGRTFVVDVGQWYGRRGDRTMRDLSVTLGVTRR